MAQFRNIVTMSLVLMLSMSIAAFAQQKKQEAPAGEGDKTKTVSLREVTQVLSREIEEAIKEGKPAPRSKSDYAKTAGDVELSERDLMTGLTRPADRNPLVDSYIKWQLLSFNPDFASMKPAELARVIDAIPSRQPVGQLPPRELSIVKAASTGRGDATMLQKIIDDFNADQKKVAELNKPNVQYCNAVFKAAGSDKGLELIAQVKALELLIDAGEDRASQTAAKKLIDQLQGLRTDASLSGGMRGELSRRIGQLTRHNRDAVTALTLKASGEVVMTDKTVNLNPKSAEEMQAYLAGREYTAAKKK